MNDAFRKFTLSVSDAAGSSWAFVLALCIIVVWGVTGPLFHFSDTWQLVINTGTTIVTFLMGFVIQNTQNRDAKAMHLKLDELLRGVEGARTQLIDLESLSDEELDRLQEQFARLRARAEQGHDVSGDIAEIHEDVEEIREGREEGRTGAEKQAA
jgi:low affinity Fe/Cu permease